MRKAKKFLALTLALAMAMSANIQFGTTQVQAASKKGKVASVKVTNVKGNYLNMKKGSSKVLKVSVKTSGKKVSKAYTFKSSNRKVVAVSKSGKNIKLKARKNGTAKVTIKTKAKPKKTKVINVTVGQKVKSVKLSRSSAVLEVGQSLKLSTTVSPSKAINKKLKWESSNSGVATVNASGVVMANKEGKSVITATAQDGSGAKATCTVTVNAKKQSTTTTTDTEVIKKDGIKDVVIKNGRFIQVTFSEKQNLSAKDFSVKTKKMSQASYNKTLKVKDAYSDDNIVYTVELYSEIDLGAYVRIEAKGKETYSADVQFIKKSYTTESYYNDRSYELNQPVFDEIYIRHTTDDSDSPNKYGYITASYTELPKGLSATYDADERDFVVTGTPTEVGTTKTVITLTDEMGNIYTKTVVFMIYSDDSLQAYATPYSFAVREDGEKANVSTRIYSNEEDDENLEYEFVGESYGLCIGREDEDDDEHGSSEVHGSLSVGKYTVKVKVTSKKNGASTIIPLEFNVIQLNKVTGTVTSQGGTPIKGAEVRATSGKPLSYEIEYWEDDEDYLHALTDAKGNYTLYLEDGTYDFTVGSDSNDYDSDIHIAYKFDQKINEDTSNLNFKSRMYAISIDKTIMSSESSNLEWVDSHNVKYGKGNVLYLNKGTYNLTCKSYSGLYARYTLNITVTGDMTNVAPLYEFSINVEKDLTSGNTYQLKMNREEINTYYSFTPATSGIYKFTIACDRYENIDVAMYNNKGALIAEYDSSSSPMSALFENLQAGEKYYLAITDVYGDFELTISEFSKEDYEQQIKKELKVGESVALNEYSGKGLKYTFTPTESGNYKFYSFDTVGEKTPMGGTQKILIGSIRDSDDDTLASFAAFEEDFAETIYCEKGYTYTLTFDTASISSGKIQVDKVNE